jgi:hypothetical protein
LLGITASEAGVCHVSHRPSSVNAQTAGVFGSGDRAIRRWRTFGAKPQNIWFRVSNCPALCFAFYE